MKLSANAAITLVTFARQQAQYHAEVVAEVGKLLQVQAVTQPNSRSTVQLHDFAYREQQQARRWARVGGAR
jgi:hypothetical protein